MCLASGTTRLIALSYARHSHFPVSRLLRDSTEVATAFFIACIAVPLSLSA